MLSDELVAKATQVMHRRHATSRSKIDVCIYIYTNTAERERSSRNEGLWTRYSTHTIFGVPIRAHGLTTWGSWHLTLMFETFTVHQPINRSASGESFLDRRYSHSLPVHVHYVSGNAVRSAVCLSAGRSAEPQLALGPTRNHLDLGSADILVLNSPFCKHCAHMVDIDLC